MTSHLMGKASGCWLAGALQLKALLDWVLAVGDTPRAYRGIYP